MRIAAGQISESGMMREQTPAFRFAIAVQAIEIQNRDNFPVCKKGQRHQAGSPAYESGDREFESEAALRYLAAIR
jgi:hypothetical protein